MEDARAGEGALAGSRVAVVANPVSGGGRARRAIAAVEAALRAQRIEPATTCSAGPGLVAEAVRRAAGGGARAIALAGGDGTLHEALPALIESRLPLILLPCGGGNDFGRALGIARDPVAAARALSGWTERAVDLGCVTGARGDDAPRLFATVAAVGFDAEVAGAVRDGRWRLPGSAAYLAAAVATLVRYRAKRLRLTGPFGTIDGTFFLAAAGNTASYGGGMRIAPGARIDDGLLEICLVDKVPRATVIRLLPKLFSGGHAGYPFVRFVRAARVEIGADAPHALFADGEPAARLPATLEIRPGALRVIAPPVSPASHHG